VSAEERVGPVVSTAWLEAHLGDVTAGAIRVLDVRGKVLPPGNTPRYRPERDAYEAAHVPGASFVDWTRDIVDADDPVPVQIAQPEAFAAKMGELGVGDGTMVVAYDDYHHAFAGRLAWALRYYGHDAVAVLDGGWSRWMSEGRPTTTVVATPAPARFTPRTISPLRRTADDVARALGDANVLLIDARPTAQYEGAASAATRAGHIPGARSVPYATLVDTETGRFRSREELARAFADAGVDVTHLPREVVVYCNGGVTCTVPLVALRLLGRDDVAVYDGSWNEWGNDPARPIHAGRTP
jgi:thiosulfate/3-mercaptopyruvate sulfurtransferase